MATDWLYKLVLLGFRCPWRQTGCINFASSVHGDRLVVYTCTPWLQVSMATDWLHKFVLLGFRCLWRQTGCINLYTLSSGVYGNRLVMLHGHCTGVHSALAGLSSDALPHVHLGGLPHAVCLQHSTTDTVPTRHGRCKQSGLSSI